MPQNPRGRNRPHPASVEAPAKAAVLPPWYEAAREIILARHAEDLRALDRLAGVK